jgi:predicted  nucleic acid-binding Zn-ribbon protein
VGKSELKQHVAGLEAKCVIEDYQGFESRIEGMTEHIATWKIKGLQETGRSLHEQDKAHNDEIDKLKARVNDIKSLLDRHERQPTVDGANVDIQDIAEKCEEFDNGLTKLHKEMGHQVYEVCH